MKRIENQVNNHPYYPDGPKRPVSASINAKPEHTVTTIGSGEDNTPIGLTLCRVISIILSIVVVICFTSLYLIKN